MRKNIIYSCYSCFGDRPKFLSLHEDLIKDYADKIDADYKIMDIKHKHYTPPVFTVYEAYEEFTRTRYEKMLYIDWDVLISLDSANIFNHYIDAPFSAYRWKDGFTEDEYEINSLEQFESHVITQGKDGKDNRLLPLFIHEVCNAVPTVEFLNHYINNAISGGVMLFDRDTMTKFLFQGETTWEQIYDKITQLYSSKAQRHIDLLKCGGVLSHFAINYLLYINNIVPTYLDKKWNTNSVTGKMKPDEYFYNFNCGGDEVLNGETFDEKDNAALSYVKNNRERFFRNPDQYKKFISQYDYKTVLSK